MLENITNQFPQAMEWVWIAIIIGLLLFGAKKIPELARTFGKAKMEYEKGKIEGDKELKDFKEKESQKPD
jgi:sec-independent protein translocase protein TatA